MADESRKRTKKKVLLLGYYGARNLGDDMMLFCLLDWLKNQGMDTSIVSENPEETETGFRVKAIKNTPLLGQWAWYDSWFKGRAYHLLKTIKQQDALLVGGGDLIRDDHGWRIFFYTIEKILFALFFNVPVYLINIGIGKPTTKAGRRILKLVIRKSQKIIVRDTRSYLVCKEFGCGQKTIPAYDIAFNLPSVLSEKNSLFPEDCQNKINTPYFVICLRGEPNAFGAYAFEEQKIINFAKAVDHMITNHQLTAVFLPFQDHKTKGDNLIHKKIIRNMNHVNSVVMRQWSGNLPEVINCIQGSSFMVGMRLHAVVMAVALNKSCAVMPYDTKLRELIDLSKINTILESHHLSNEKEIIHCFENTYFFTPRYDLMKHNIWEKISLNV